VEEEGLVEVPDHLKDSSRDRKALGHGEGYLYPHHYPDHFVRQQYLPDRIQGRRYYTPSDQGYEKKIRERLELWRRQDAED
jgi:putative ATPase